MIPEDVPRRTEPRSPKVVTLGSLPKPSAISDTLVGGHPGVLASWEPAAKVIGTLQWNSTCVLRGVHGALSHPEAHLVGRWDMPSSELLLCLSPRTVLEHSRLLSKNDRFDGSYLVQSARRHTPYKWRARWRTKCGVAQSEGDEASSKPTQSGTVWRHSHSKRKRGGQRSKPEGAKRRSAPKAPQSQPAEQANARRDSSSQIAYSAVFAISLPSAPAGPHDGQAWCHPATNTPQENPKRREALVSAANSSHVPRRSGTFSSRGASAQCGRGPDTA